MTKAAQKKTHAGDQSRLTIEPGLIFHTESEAPIPLSDLSNRQLSITSEPANPIDGVIKISGSLTRTFELSGYINPDQTICFTLAGVPYTFIGAPDSEGFSGKICSNSTKPGRGGDGDEGTWSAQAPRT
jgi:hypothetical protein